MSEADSTGKTPFDLDRLQQLVEMMEKHGLSEVNLRRGDEQWRLRRGAREVVHAAPPQMTFAAPAPSPIRMIECSVHSNATGASATLNAFTFVAAADAIPNASNSLSP